ncbi:cell wall metabolism sensor histidine kinase WalK [Salinibacterium sp. M195]|uniref:sensor histidine kinase n=1 Tax=Salinibacterium sp. M195 TaxID=2583374 RepID=UPI001C634B6E|nr:HAMP domain-containing sensor histidine kinase [Salinibacterium sp. M195]QYH34515.1 HAMP domain-containing histidine kinase [Salinibacterium sp. M195]
MTGQNGLKAQNGRPKLSLRNRLVLGTTALIALAALVIGVVSVLALQGFLVNRLDTQLTSATGRSQGALDGRPGGNNQKPPPTRDFLALPGQREGTLAGLISSSGDVTAGVLGKNGSSTPLTEAQLATLADLTRIDEPVTVNLGSELGDYRVVLSKTPVGGEMLLVALPLADVRATVVQLTAVVVGIGVLALAIAAIVGAIAVRFALRPLERVADTATRVAELQLDRGAVALAERVSSEDSDPRTEVGQVGAALNQLLAHVASALSARQASENKVRAFVADASHELRTPLASIRGYAELTRRGGHDIPDDVAHAIGRIEAESVRMTGLVESLLLLARLDEHVAIERKPVDLSRLLIDAVSDAHAAGPDHKWELELPDASVTIRGDRARLHQVVANLLANARVHTPAGTQVTSSLMVDGRRAIIEVRDTGPGISLELQPTVFERFVRGDSSRSRAAGSTGLGLSIVAAVAQAHGGTVTVSSEPGNTVFRLELPGFAATPAIP